MDFKLGADNELLLKKFSSIGNIQDVADLLEINSSFLNYYLYQLPPDKKYTRCLIPKKSGGDRELSIPNDSLKIIQQKLNYILQLVYKPKSTVHGFARDKSILTNARVHLKKKYVFNIDLYDFFPSINFGRVRGMFINSPYHMDPKAATVLAQICCFNNTLPQGAPTSPVISNMICSKLDTALRRFAENQKCFYTRYADDITFSTTRSKFPQEIAKIGVDGNLVAGDELSNIINLNGFKINNSKLRMRTKRTRQEVTGLTVNQFPNVQRKFVRQISSMLHSWEKHGLESAQKEFWEKYDKKHRPPYNRFPSYKNVVKGKIDYLGMVRGKDDSVYSKLLKRYAKLNPDYDYKPAKIQTLPSQNVLIPRVMTEGKTDWKHLKSALIKLRNQGLFTNLEIEFNEYEDDIQMGHDQLYQLCVTRSKTKEDRKLICIFDRDNAGIINKVSDNSNEYNFRSWGNNVYSFVIPIPDHRKDNPSISIEFYYHDTEIKRKDSNGRRLYLGSEFRPSTRHSTEDLVCRDRNKVGKVNTIIDSDVYDINDNNVALPKDDFANYILNGEENFNDFGVAEFQKILDIIQKIISIE